MMQRACGAMLVAALLAAGARPAPAQTAQITGKITDPSGAVVPGAEISAVNLETGSRRETVSNSEGYYALPLLPPGTYDVRAHVPGFKAVTRAGVKLEVQQVARIDLSLEIGGSSEEVRVTAAAPGLESETSALGKVIDSTRIQSLPLLGRNPYSLVALVPGARPSAGLNDLPVDQISTAFVSINGARANQNEYLLDGAPNTAAAQNQPVVFANADSVAEFKVETNSYSAQFGRSGGGVFNVVTKSGTNEFHGTAYDYLRNDVLNANSFFSNRAGIDKSAFRFNQFGATGGGPLRLGRLYDGRRSTFFFGSYESVRFSQGGTYVGTVPSLLERAGDFSQTRNTQGQTIQIFDPLTTRRNPANPNQFLRDPFDRNVVPRSQWDPVAAKALGFIPLPNTAGSATTGANNYVVPAVNRIRKDTFSIRLDHALSGRQRLNGRYSFDRTPLVRANVYGSNASPTFGPQVFTRQNVALDHTVTFSPNMIGSVLYSFTRLSNVRRPLSLGFDYATLGLPSALNGALVPPSFPSINVTGMGGSSSLTNSGTANLLGGNDFITFGDNTHALLGNVTRLLGRHTLKLGGEGRLIRPNYQQFGDSTISFQFGQAFTQGPDPTRSSSAAGYGFASFLLGVATGSYSYAPALAMQHAYYGFFLQDDFKVSSRLTLNLGLRYEYESPRTERYNQLANFDYAAAAPSSAPGLTLRGALAYPGVGGRPRTQWDPDRNNVAPRAGFAYRLTQRTVLRGGAGIFYAAITGVGGAAGSFGVSGFEAATSIVTSLDGVTPTTFFSNPYPNGINQPTGSRLGLATLLGQSIRFVDRDLATPYSAQWNLDLQRELPAGFLLEVGYAGNRGLKLFGDLDLDQLPDSALSQGAALRDLITNPFFGAITTGPLASSTVSRAQLLRPYPHFSGVTALNSSWAASSYHSGFLSASRRFAQGLALQASYTFSKLIDQVTGAFAGETLSGGSVQNFNNLRAERSISALDAPHRLVVNGVWSLPVGAGRRWQPPRPASALVGGWELSAIATLQSGGPLGITSASNTTFAQGGGQRPNFSGVSPRVAQGERSVTRWINAAAFVAPPAYAFGNAPRTFGDARSDGISNIDFSAVKNTRLAERLTVQFRSEFFNLLNTARLAPPNTSFGSPQFGAISNQANQPRVIQFALKLIL